MMTIAVVVGLALLALGVPIFGVFLLLAGAGALDSTRGFFEEFGGAVQSMFSLGTNPVTAPILSTIPLFILAGFLMAEAKTADRAVRVAQAAFGWLPGGLAICTIFACALFTTFTGASGVTIVALGGLLMPALLKQRYPEGFSLGLLAGTGSVGLLFPPAVPLFVYGKIYGLAAQAQAAASGTGDLELISFTTDRFIFAGIVPGMVLIGLMSIYAIYVAVKHDVPRQRFDLRELRRAALVALPELLIPVLIIAGLLKGLQLPQLASLTVLYVLILELVVYRDIEVRSLAKVLGSALALAGAIFAIVFTAQAFTNYLVTAQVPQKILEFILETFRSKWSFLLALNVMLLIVGMVMDIFSAIVVVVPLIAPAATRMGIDPYHLGVIFLLNLEVGYLTPPVGLNLFVTSFTFKRSVVEVTRASMPQLVTMLVALMIVTYVPALTIVPEPARRGRVSELARRVKVAHEQASAVQELTLPDGKPMKRTECDALEGLDRDDCNGLFLDVTKCRAGGAGASGGDCERKAIQSYLDLKSDDDDEEGLDLDEDDDEAAAGADAGE
jgi:tripartite ATP-independent transporter DctM subunit